MDVYYREDQEYREKEEEMRHRVRGNPASDGAG